MYEALALAAPIVAIALVVSLCRSPLVGAVLVLAMAVANAWFVELPGIELGVMLYPTDAVALLIALAALVRITAKQSVRVPPSGLIFTTLLILSFLIGLAEFGQSAGVDFRVMFAFIAGVFYFASFDTDSELVVRLARVWVGAACTLMLIAWVAWMADAAGLAMARKWLDAEPLGLRLRVLNAGSTYVIGVGSVVLLHLLMREQMGVRWWPVLFTLSGTVLVLQHRSVWVATFLSAVLIVLLVQRGRARVFLFVGAIALLAVAVVPLMSHRLSAVSESVSAQAERATDMTKGTSGARVSAWEVLLKDWQKLGLGLQLIGKPFGSRYAGLTNAPHNCYLQVMYRTGYVGLLAMLAMYGSTMIRLLGRRPGTAEGGGGVETLLLALIIGQLAFFIPYAFTPEQGILMGTAIGYVGRKPLRRSAAMSQFEDSLGMPPAPTDAGGIKHGDPLDVGFPPKRISRER